MLSVILEKREFESLFRKLSELYLEFVCFLGFVFCDFFIPSASPQERDGTRMTQIERMLADKIFHLAVKTMMLADLHQLSALILSEFFGF